MRSAVSAELRSGDRWPRPTGGMGKQVSAIFELARLLRRYPSLRRLPRGDGSPVLIFPGFLTGDGSTWVLRTFLRRRGWDARGWGIGRNNGSVGKLLPKAIESTLALHRTHGRPVHLIGWSLGGVIARGVAREHPEAVASLITLGTPVVGGPKYTSAAGHYEKQGIDLDDFERRADAREAVPLAVPLMALYSKRDGVVVWQSCIDEVNQQAEHVEVHCNHVGLGFSPEVFALVARRLAQPDRSPR